MLKTASRTFEMGEKSLNEFNSKRFIILDIKSHM
jgi:hypothetical protein